MTTRAGSRGARGLGTRAGARGAATREEIPADLAGRWELLVKLASERLYDMHQRVRKAIGHRPYGGLPVSTTERAGRWAQLADDPKALAELLHSNAKYTVDGRALVPNELLEEMTTQHERRQRGGYD